MAYLLSGYLSNSIFNLLNIENKSETKNKKEEIIMNLFDYIKKKILFNKTLKNTSYPVYFLNCLFSNKYILHYYIVNYNNNALLKENQQNSSFKQEMIENNNNIIDYIRQNQCFILFMKDILNSFIELDSNFLNGNKNNLMKNKTINTRTNENKIRINELKSNVEKMDEIFEKNNAIKSFEKTHIIFLFLLDTSLLDKYFTSFGYFINVDYTLIQLYSILRNQNMSVKLNEKIIGFIKKYNAPNNLGFSFMGIMNNQKIFNSFFKYKNISELYNYNLYDIIKYIIGKLFLNLRENEGIIQKFMNIFLKIIEYINQHYKINQNLANQEF